MLSEEIVLQLLRMKALVSLSGGVHFKKIRSLIYNQTNTSSSYSSILLQMKTLTYLKTVYTINGLVF